MLLPLTYNLMYFLEHKGREIIPGLQIIGHNPECVDGLPY